MKLALALLTATLCISSDLSSQTNCAAFNNTYGPYSHYTADTGQHSSGDHDWINVTQGSCTYSGTANPYPSTACGVHATASSSSTVFESGSTGIWWHSAGYKDAQGASDGPAGGSANADSEGVAAVASCAILPCGMAINISGGGAGGGFNVSYNPTPYWFDTVHYANSACSGHTLPPHVSCQPVGKPPYPVEPPFYWYWNYDTCSWMVGGTTPVIVDTKGNGFRFSDIDKGQYASFDMRGDGKYEKLSWPEFGSGNMWLVLPNENGAVTSGKELFGNFTPHSDGGVEGHPNPNGFLALAWYDAPDQGGDGNLILDARDEVWARLRLWDPSRCLKDPDGACTSQTNELYSLASMGIYSISLLWEGVDKMPAGTEAAINKDGSPVFGNLGGPLDTVGNQYKYKALLNPDAENTPVDDKGNSCCDLHKKSQDGRWAFDVYLRVATQQ